MGYKEIHLIDIPVLVVGNNTINFGLSLTHDKFANLDVSLSCDGLETLNDSEIALSSLPGITPRISLNSAHITTSSFRMSNKNSAETINLLVPEVCLDYVDIAADSHDLAFRAYVSGLNFLKNWKSFDFFYDGRTFTLELMDNPVETKELLETSNNSAITAFLETKLSNFEELTTVLQNVENLLWIISFALGRSNNLARFDITDVNGTVLRSVVRDKGLLIGGFRAPIPFDNPSIFNGFKEYLEHCTPFFTSINSTFAIDKLIHISLLIRTQFFVEVKALLIANFFEILRYNFAKNILVQQGRARLVENEFYFPLDVNRGRRMHFEEILKLLFEDLSLSGWDSKFKDMRNTIIHTGRVIGSNFHEEMQNVFDALHFCDRLILAFLRYDEINGIYSSSNFLSYLDPFVPFSKN